MAGEVEPFDPQGYPLDPYAEVVPGLFQAGCTLSLDELYEAGFQAVFDLGGWNRAGCEDGCTCPYAFYLIDDVPWIPDPGAIDALAVRVTAALGEGKRVVVNCSAGLNRSGLLVARSLIMLGNTPERAIELVRRARGPHALSNVAFTRYLLIDCIGRSLGVGASPS
jgi:hypothetical protein